MIRTDHSENFGTDADAVDHPHIGQASAEALGESGVSCVGIESLNIDGTSVGDRPVHTTLLGVEIPIVEPLTGLRSLPERGFTFTAVPPKIAGAGTFIVRAHATVQERLSRVCCSTVLDGASNPGNIVDPTVAGTMFAQRGSMNDHHHERAARSRW